MQLQLSSHKQSTCNAGDPRSVPWSGRSSGERASLVVQLVKNPPTRIQCGRPGFHRYVGKIPWRWERLPTPVVWPGQYRGLYSPWGRKESDTAERLSLSLTFTRGMGLHYSTSLPFLHISLCFPLFIFSFRYFLLVFWYFS